jgi:GntR family transcriptional regulator
MMDVRLPRYHQLRDELAEQIARNMWAPGTPIPPEAELASVHGVAIGTVRKAVDALVADGFVERQQGRGTFVRRPSFDHSLFRFFRYQGQSSGSGIIPESRLLSRATVQPAPDHVAQALQLGPKGGAIRITRLRLAAGTPILLEEIWLPQDRFKPILHIPEADIGPLLYPAYERLCGEVVARAEETLTIGVADGTEAELLGTKPNAPLVLIQRLAFGFDGGPLEWRRSRGAAEKFQYKVELR